MSNVDYVIVGGGLSGMTFAHYAAKQNKKVVVLEKESTLGGCIHTAYPYNNDFFVEVGSHTVYNSYGTFTDMIENLDILSKIIKYKKQPYRTWFGDKLHPIWYGVNPFMMALALFRIKTLKQHGKTTQEYYTKLVGKTNFRNIIHPVTSAVICQDSSEVASDLLLKRRAKNSTFPRSFTLEGGLITLLNSIAKDDNIDLHLSTEATKISKTNDIYKVKASDGKTYQAKNLVVATPANLASELIKQIQPDMATHLGELPMHKTKAFNITTEKKYFHATPFSYAIARDKPFRSVVTRDVVPHNRYRSISMHFKPEAEPKEHLEDILKTLMISDEAPLTITEKEFMLPELKVSHYEWREKLLGMLSSDESFILLGNYFDGLSMEDCAIRAKKQATGEVDEPKADTVMDDIFEEDTVENELTTSASSNKQLFNRYDEYDANKPFDRYKGV